MIAMTATTKQKRAPALSSSAAGYSADVYSWAFEQADLVEARRFDEIDIANIAEELRSLGRSEYRALESALAVVLLHLLKWDHQPERRSRSWALSIAEHRVQVEEELTTSPGLKPRVGEVLLSAYRKARLRAARETRLPLAMLPGDCPYDFKAAMDRPVPIDL